MAQKYSIIAVVQNGRLAYEALVLAASFAVHNPRMVLTLMEPVPSGAWNEETRVPPDIRAALLEFGVEILPFAAEHFGASYPNGNKIEALLSAPDGPFVFVDTDTILLDSLDKVPFDFDYPTASMRREGTWPKPGAFSYEQIWRALYARFGVDFERSLDTHFGPEDWQRYLYFNAGFFCGSDASLFAKSLLRKALSVRDNPLPELAEQVIYPWLDQIVLPLTIAEMGGGRSDISPDWMDGTVSCHWRVLPLCYARERDDVVDFMEEICGDPRVKPLLERYEPFAKLVYGGQGRVLRDELAGQVFSDEKALRKAIKAKGLWLR